MTEPINLHELRRRSTHEALRRVALAQFASNGFGNVTVTQLATEAGVTERTFFRHFPSKEALFEGLVTATCESMREGLENAPTADMDKPIANRLADELRAFTSALIEPDGLALYRLIVADGWRFPELARVFDRSGMRVIRRRIAELLETGGAPDDQSRQVAAEVVALALGDAYQRALLGIAEDGDGEVFARQIDVAVKYGLGRAV